jgi:hypothetical protein
MQLERTPGTASLQQRGLLEGDTVLRVRGARRTVVNGAIRKLTLFMP